MTDMVRFYRNSVETTFKLSAGKVVPDLKATCVPFGRSFAASLPTKRAPLIPPSHDPIARADPI
jgi:hypothetical protein